MINDGSNAERDYCHRVALFGSVASLARGWWGGV